MSRPILSAAGARILTEAATAAPSMHNTQPWRFEVGDDRIEVYADPARSLPLADAGGRAVHLACGAALLNLRVAAAHIGYDTRVRLWARGGRPTHLATVELMAGATTPSAVAALARLYDTIALRRTNRGPFDGRPVPAGLAHELAVAAEIEGARLRLPAGPERERVKALVRGADRAWSADERLVAERARWVGAGRVDDGIPLASLGPIPENASALVRDLGAGAPAAGPRAHARFEDDATLAVLETDDDSPSAWLRAGQALERVLLVATAHGLSASFLNGIIELPRERWLLRDPTGGRSFAQMVLRLGYGAPTPATPRRPVEEVSHRS
jgi:nitroreductase